MEKLSTSYDMMERRGFIPTNVPACIADNLNPRLELRDYQRSAISRLAYYVDEDPEKKFPVEILFNMATGSGKTVIMAAAILYFYQKGYRNFVFFVDKTNIITKTIDNFLNATSPKYLFNESLFIDGKNVAVRQVENFSDHADDAINIHFTTISGLHSRLRTPKENQVTFEDFEKEKTVFLSDEAHHINADTRNDRTREEEEAYRSWEYTVNKLVRSHTDNVLLEFTATIDWKDEAIAKKYASRVLIEYDLRKFREDKFSKDIFLLQSDADLDDRVLQATIISQYRRKIAEKHGIALKPVILFKSKIIRESQENHLHFIALMEGLKASDLQRQAKIAQSVAEKDHIFKKAFHFFEEQGIGMSELVQELRIEFSKDRLVEVNSDEESQEKQILINTLEAPSNEIRAIFAVDKLNEGWDVLNLFDIVRLYGTRDSGKPTVQEAQLVGRGARYFPFALGDDTQKYVRKFDEDIHNELRVIEQLHFHSIQNHRYIAELRQALIESGIHKDQGREITIAVKNSFLLSRFYKNGLIWKNSRIPNKREHISSLADYKVPTTLKIQVDGGTSMSEVSGFSEKEIAAKEEQKALTIQMNDLPIHVVRRVLDRITFFHFANLREYFPQLESIDEFITNKQYLGGISIEIRSADGSYSTEALFRKLIPLLEVVRNTILANTSEFQGSRTFMPVAARDAVIEKTMYIQAPEAGSAQEFGRSMKDSRSDLQMDLTTKDWYAYDDDYGTDEEKYFIKFIADRIDKLKKSFSEIHLVRNQKIVELYDFEQGRRFEPDYLLFLGNEKKESGYIQIFIEPKGSHIEAGDEWKQAFLLELKSDENAMTLFENDTYNVIGLPFYQEAHKREFDEAFKKGILA